MSGADALKRLSTPLVDTRTAERRVVRVGSWDDLEREIGRIVAASEAGGEGFRVTGNWSAGQIFEHLARTMARSLDGFRARPRSEMEVPGGVAGVRARAERVRAAGEESAIKAALLAREWPGALGRVPSVGAPAETDPPEQVWTAHGADYLKAMIRRVRDGHPMDKPSPTAGRLTQAEWEAFHLRHAGWHLGLVVLGEKR